jgi:hypothetical protein
MSASPNVDAMIQQALSVTPSLPKAAVPASPPPSPQSSDVDLWGAQALPKQAGAIDQIRTWMQGTPPSDPNAPYGKPLTPQAQQFFQGAYDTTLGPLIDHPVDTAVNAAAQLAKHVLMPWTTVTDSYGAVKGMVDKARTQPVPQTLGNIGGMVGMAGVGEAGEPTGGTLSDSLDALKASSTLPPDVAMAKAIPVRHDAMDWMDNLPTVRGDIKSAAAIRDAQGNITGYRPLDDIKSVYSALQGAKGINRAVADLYGQPFRQANAQFPTDPIADAIEAGIPQTLKIEARTSPQAAQQVQQIQQVAKAYRGTTMGFDQLRDLQIQLNAEANSLYHGTLDKQNASMAAKGGPAAINGMLGAIRGIWRQYLGDDFADIQQRWGALDDLDAGMRSKYGKVISSDETGTPVDAAMNRYVGAPAKLLRGDVAGAKTAWAGGAKTSELLKSAFDQTEPSAMLPYPRSGMGQFGMPNARGPVAQLPPATPQIGDSPQPPITGGMPPEWQQNIWKDINAAKRLPPATQINMPPPDAVGPHPTTSASPYIAGRGPSQQVVPPRFGDTLAQRLAKIVLGGQ